MENKKWRGSERTRKEQNEIQRTNEYNCKCNNSGMFSCTCARIDEIRFNDFAIITITNTTTNYSLG